MNVLMLEDFLRGVAEDSPAGASGVDGLRALEIVLSAYRSAEDNEPKRGGADGSAGSLKGCRIHGP
jgi:hypothetical protein